MPMEISQPRSIDEAPQLPVVSTATSSANQSTELNIDDILLACNIDTEGLKQSVDLLKGLGELLPTPKKEGEFAAFSEPNDDSSNAQLAAKSDDKENKNKPIPFNTSEEKPPIEELTFKMNLYEFVESYFYYTSALLFNCLIRFCNHTNENTVPAHKTVVYCTWLL